MWDVTIDGHVGEPVDNLDQDSYEQARNDVEAETDELFQHQNADRCSFRFDAMTR